MGLFGLIDNGTDSYSSGSSGSQQQSGSYGYQATSAQDAMDFSWRAMKDQQAYNTEMMKDQQAYNKEMMLEQQKYNSAEAAINRDWQKSMSDTSYQRAVEDMVKAGINPIVAYSQGGASTPTGGAASGNMAASSMASSGLAGGIASSYGESSSWGSGSSWGVNSAVSMSNWAQQLEAVGAMFGNMFSSVADLGTAVTGVGINGIVQSMISSAKSAVERIEVQGEKIRTKAMGQKGTKR